MKAKDIIEAETPKRTFKEMKKGVYDVGYLKVGETVVHGTSDTRDIMRGTFNAIKQLNPAYYQAEFTDEIEAYLNGDDPAEFDPEFYLFERLFDIVTERFCPPFSYYGFLEADGSVGCWPWDKMSLESAQDNGSITMQEGTNPDFNVETPYVYLENTGQGGVINMSVWDTETRRLVWSW